MISSNNSRVSANSPPSIHITSWNENSSWEQVNSDCQALISDLERQGARFLPGMIKLFSYVTYFRSILQDQKVKGYLMAKHPELLKNVELTLRQLEQQEESAESQTVPLWTIAKARKELRALITLARTNEPQVIGFNKKPLVVMVAAKRWKLILKHFPQAERLACPKVKTDDQNLVCKRPGKRSYRQVKLAPWLTSVGRIG